MDNKNGSFLVRYKSTFNQKGPGLRTHLFGAIWIVAFIVVLLGVNAAHADTRTSQNPAAPGNKEVVYPASLFDDGKAHHFQYKTNDGVPIKYFVMKSSDGVIRAAFDTCVVCWREGKGYVQKDDSMICKNCGRRFKSTKINEVTGGCNPAPLVRKVENGKVVIKTENLVEGRQLFASGGGK
ncbi:MAG TPA: DUF2318 domain-containing protein [Syntrophorhabdaceae bacterium]|jgi:uncharacterized membrane protein